MATILGVQLAPDATGLLARLMARLLERAVRVAPDAASRLAGRRIRLRADQQVVTLEGVAEGLRITTDDAGAADVEIVGDLAALLAAARGRHVREWLAGRLRLRGRLWRGLPLLALFRALRAEPAEGADVTG